MKLIVIILENKFHLRSTVFHFGEIVVLFFTGHASIHAIFYQDKYILYTKTNMLIIYQSQCLGF